MIRFYIQNLEDFDEACEALDSCGVKFELTVATALWLKMNFVRMRSVSSTNMTLMLRGLNYAASQQNQSPKTMPILRCLSRKSSTQRPLVPPAKRLFAESPCYRRRRPNCSVGYAIR